MKVPRKRKKKHALDLGKIITIFFFPNNENYYILDFSNM